LRANFNLKKTQRKIPMLNNRAGILQTKKLELSSDSTDSSLVARPGIHSLAAGSLTVREQKEFQVRSGRKVT